MGTITIDAEAGQVSSELARLGISANTRVHATVEVPEEGNDGLPPFAALAEEGRAFEWLRDEPDLYSDADVVFRAP